MDASEQLTLDRAMARGLTVQNGGAYLYVAPNPNNYEEEELNKLRPYGLERMVFAKGEKYMLLLKTTEEEEQQPDDAQALTFDNGAYATGNAPCVCVKWIEGVSVTVKVEGRPEGKDEIDVPLTWRSMDGVTMPSFALKPYMERVVDLAQGLEWDGVVEVDASRIFGRGKFYVAITRARKLSNLVVTGLGESFDELRQVLKSSWRGLHWLRAHGLTLPRPCDAYASRMARSHT